MAEHPLKMYEHLKKVDYVYAAQAFRNSDRTSIYE